MRWLPTLLIALLASACGFEPVYQQRAGDVGSVDILQQVVVETPQGRSGDQFKAELEDRFYQHAVPAQSRYKLALTLDLKDRAFIIDPDGISSRYEVIAKSHYRLLRQTDNTLLYEGDIQRQVSYNVSEEDDYATYIAKRDAYEQAIEVLASDLALRVATRLSQAGRAQP